MYQWHVVWCGSKNTDEKYVFVKEIRLHVENMITVLDSCSQLNKEDLNDHINEHENYLREYNIHISSKSYEESGYDPDLDLLTKPY